MTIKSTQEKKFIPKELRELKDKKYPTRFEKGKANDNLEYGTKKYAIQNFNNYANIVLDGLDSGLNVDVQDLKILDTRYRKLKDIGANTDSADKKVNEIKTLFKEHQNMKKKGKDPFIEKQAFDV